MLSTTHRNSSVSDFITCPAKYYLNWIRKLEPTEKNINLEFGSSIHLGAETFFKLVKAGADPKADTTKQEVVRKFIDDFTNKDFEHHVSKNVVVGNALLVDMFDKYYDLKAKNILAVEEKFEKRIKGYTYTGKIDLLLLERGRKTITDHKTAGRLTAQLASKWQLARQFLGYKWLTDAEDVKVNLFHCIKGNGSTAFPMIYQIPLLFSDFKQEKWEHQTFMVLEEIEERIRGFKSHLANPRFSYIPDMLFPRLGTMCNIYGCEFESICSQDLPITEVMAPIGLFQERKNDGY